MYYMLMYTAQAYKTKKEIVSLVAEKFKEILDYPYISKIIKEEERLRK